MKSLVPPGRIVGLDVARCLALLGMMATHILDPIGGSEITLTQQVAGGRASALFAVLAGVSLALMSGGRTPLRGRGRLAISAGLAVRALLIALLGLLLGEVESGIAVILTYYGLLFLLGLPFLGLGAGALAWLSAGWLLVVPVLSHLVRPELPAPSYVNPSLESLADPGQLLSELAFTGYYPAVPWLAYLLAGMAIGRADLSRWRTTGLLAAAGGGLVVASSALSTALVNTAGVMGALRQTFEGPGLRESMGLTLDVGLFGTTPTGSWWWLAVDAPHTATPFDLAGTIGSALLVIGLSVMAGRLLPQLLAVAFGAGAMTLTLYSAHVFLRGEGRWDGDDLSTYLGQVAPVLLVGAAYRLAGRRGPLEAAMTGASNVVQSTLRPSRARARR